MSVSLSVCTYVPTYSTTLLIYLLYNHSIAMINRCLITNHVYLLIIANIKHTACIINLFIIISNHNNNPLILSY